MTSQTAAAYQVFPPLTDSEYKLLKADIANSCLKESVEIDVHGNILDGHHRAQACDELGIDWRKTAIELEFGSERAKRVHVLMKNLARRHLSKKQLQEVAVKTYKDLKWSARRTAKKLGVSTQSVLNWVADAGVQNVTVLGEDNRRQRAASATKKLAMATRRLQKLDGDKHICGHQLGKVSRRTVGDLVVLTPENPKLAIHVHVEGRDVEVCPGREEPARTPKRKKMAGQNK